MSKFVEFVWLLVVLILISSYIATLASLITIEQFELASKGGSEEPWGFMHRFNITADLVEVAKDADELGLVGVLV
ncbi:ionotropic glutamate receptor, metazoa, periplasmic binding protein-like protein I [Tanacetum coccineum]